jgi:hypothetical protein
MARLDQKLPEGLQECRCLYRLIGHLSIVSQSSDSEICLELFAESLRKVERVRSKRRDYLVLEGPKRRLLLSFSNDSHLDPWCNDIRASFLVALEPPDPLPVAPRPLSRSTVSDHLVPS